MITYNIMNIHLFAIGGLNPAGKNLLSTFFTDHIFQLLSMCFDSNFDQEIFFMYCALICMKTIYHNCQKSLVEKNVF